MTSAAESFSARLARTRQKRNDDWWSIVFGGPIAQVLVALVAEVRWITPNRVTWASFVLKLAAVPLILAGSREADLAAVACLQLNVIFDCVDGVLARYRRAGSVSGAFLDKVTDLIGLFGVVLAVAVRLREAAPGAALALLVGCGLWCARLYSYWVVAFIEKEHRVPNPTARADKRQPFGELRFGQRLAYYLRSTWRIALVAEADVYFWLGVALVGGWLVPVAWGVGVGLGAVSLAMVGYRFVVVTRLDALLGARR